MSFPFEARGLSRKKADGAWLLRDASLCVAPGERIGISGPSGAGKTVLLRSLAALDPLAAGSLCWSGAEVTDDTIPLVRSQVLYASQRPTFVDGTVERNLKVSFSLEVHRDKRFERARAVELLGRLGKAAAFIDKPVDDLSGGEGQVAALVRALLLDPAILLLDEPTAALDVHGAALVEKLLLDWVDEAVSRRALVCVSHDEALLGRLATRRLYVAAATLGTLP